MRWFLSLFARPPVPVITPPAKYEWTPVYQRPLAAKLLAVGMGRVNEGRR